MQAFVYYLSLPFIYLISVLPFPVLYAVSDLLYLLLYRTLGYRRKVVEENLRRSFPGKTAAELNVICRRFYHHLFDLILETLKTLTISKKEMLRRCAMHPDAKRLFDDFASENRSMILMLGHQGHWEWGGNTFSLLQAHQLYVIYHPLSNRYFDGLMYRMRTRFGTRLIAMRDTLRDMLANRDTLHATAFIADQSPKPETAHWLSFLHQDTAFFKGAEKISQKLNNPIVYVLVHKLGRGRYELRAEVLCAAPKGLPEGAITEAYAKMLERDIEAQPYTWLWSHRRWKHSRHLDVPSTAE